MSSIQSEPVNASPARPWPADRSERWLIGRLIPYANHARLHSEADLDKIAAAIRKWGWTMRPLVDENGVLIVGHPRVGHRSTLRGRLRPVLASAPRPQQRQAGAGRGVNDNRADWREAYALFPGDVAYVWHGALHGNILAAGLSACGFQLRTQIV